MLSAKQLDRDYSGRNDPLAWGNDGGGPGIRTLGYAMRTNGFQDRLLRPLGQPSCDHSAVTLEACAGG